MRFLRTCFGKLLVSVGGDLVVVVVLCVGFVVWKVLEPVVAVVRRLLALG